MKNVCGNRKGFTLIELLVAITIFAVGLLAVAGMQWNALRYDSRANASVVGEAMAQGVLSELLSQPWNTASSIYSTSNTNNNQKYPYSDPVTNSTTLSVGGSGEGNGTYTAAYTIAFDANNSGAWVTVVVTPDSDPSRQFTLEGYKAFL